MHIIGFVANAKQQQTLISNEQHSYIITTTKKNTCNKHYLTTTINAATPPCWLALHHCRLVCLPSHNWWCLKCIHCHCLPLLSAQWLPDCCISHLRSTCNTQKQPTKPTTTTTTSTTCDTMTNDHFNIFRLNTLNDCGIFVADMKYHQWYLHCTMLSLLLCLRNVLPRSQWIHKWWLNELQHEWMVCCIHKRTHILSLKYEWRLLASPLTHLETHYHPWGIAIW